MKNETLHNVFIFQKSSKDSKYVNIAASITVHVHDVSFLAWHSLEDGVLFKCLARNSALFRGQCLSEGGVH